MSYSKSTWKFTVSASWNEGFAKLQQANQSGSIGIRFMSSKCQDGATEKIAATAMSLAYGPLHGLCLRQ
jgi:hypothetical protein